MSRTRRLAAILAADVAGYSRLMGAALHFNCLSHKNRLQPHKNESAGSLGGCRP
jgi:hypothetical protein